jgi:hypothetical protein
MDFVTTRQLRSRGLSRRDIERAIGSGELSRVRRGRYTTLQPDDERVIAARVGGQLTGVSAIAALGGWLPTRPRVIHVAVPRTHSRLRHPASPVRVHWVDRPASEASIADLTDVLVRVALDEDLETTVSCFDWALASASIDVIDYERILNALPIRARVLRSWVDAGSQSILESVARVRVLRRGWSVRARYGSETFRQSTS